MSGVADSLSRLEAYVRKEGFQGWDPFDGLNSELFQGSPFRRSRLARLAVLQLCKRSPINLRPLLRVPKGKNYKGLGLFLAGMVRLYRARGDERYRQDGERLMGELEAGISEGYCGACWGYNFDWQARAFFQPKYTPTVVATTFVANALLDAYETWGIESGLRLAQSACDFILRDLNRSGSGDSLCFSYSPEDQSCVYNASLLGAQLLARVSAIMGESALMAVASQAVAYVVARQRPDGSWVYGDLPYHGWVDSFHTGFILDCLDDYVRFSGDSTCQGEISRGFDFYRGSFFLPDGAPRYYDNQTYPIDGHSAAQAILTLCRFGDLAMAEKVAGWALSKLQAPEGFFYYQIGPHRTNRIPYMRWIQAWMFRALAELTSLEEPVRVSKRSCPSSF